MAKRLEVSRSSHVGWESHHLCLYFSCPVKDSAAQSYHHQDRREWSWLSVCTPLGLVFHAHILPRHYPHVGHLKNMYCPIICCPAGSRGTSILPCVGMAAAWKPGERNVDEKSSFSSDDTAASSFEDNSTTAGCREVTCMRRAYANSLQIGLASVIHPFTPSPLQNQIILETDMLFCLLKLTKFTPPHGGGLTFYYTSHVMNRFIHRARFLNRFENGLDLAENSIEYVLQTSWDRKSMFFSANRARPGSQKLLLNGFTEQRFLRNEKKAYHIRIGIKFDWVGGVRRFFNTSGVGFSFVSSRLVRRMQRGASQVVVWVLGI